VKHPPFRFAIAAAVAGTTLAAPRAARAADPVPQNNEVEVNVDATFATQSNESLVDGVYRYYVAPLDKKDDVVPALRRFVHHPSTLFVHGDRDSEVGGTSTYLGGGAEWWLGDRAFVGGEAGGSYVDVIRDDDAEGSYLDASLRAEAGFRPAELLHVSLSYKWTPVLYDLPPSGLPQSQAHRSGATHLALVGFGASSPGDTVLFTAHLGVRANRWSFAQPGYQPGDLDGTFGVADMRLSYQSDREKSWFISLRGYYGEWNNQRDIDDISTIGGERKKNVFGVQGDLGFVYWFEGHWGFRVSMGGGYDGRPPLAHEVERGLIRFGVGFVSRY
jgi:hypothetical protein